MKNITLIFILIMLLFVSSCTQYDSQSPVIDYKNTTSQNKDSLQSSSNIITASFVVVPPKENQTTK